MPCAVNAILLLTAQARSSMASLSFQEDRSRRTASSLSVDEKKKPLLRVASSLDFVHTATNPFSGFFFLNEKKGR